MSSMSIDSQHKRNVARVCPLVFLHTHYGSYFLIFPNFFGWRVNRVAHLASGGIVVVVLPDDFRHRGHRDVISVVGSDDVDVMQPRTFAARRLVLPFSRIASQFCQVNDATSWRFLYTYRHASSHDVVTVSLRWTRASDFRK